MFGGVNVAHRGPIVSSSYRLVLKNSRRNRDVAEKDRELAVKPAESGFHAVGD
jgi:hypothetical protein